MAVYQRWHTSRIYSLPNAISLYINDIVADIQSCNRFADDTILYTIVDNPTSAAEMINTDLEIIHRWAENG